MLDHVTFSVSDIEAAKRFYLEALAPIGYAARYEFDHEGTTIVGIGSEAGPEVWFYRGEKTRPRAHFAFRAQRRAQVDEFHARALAAGGSDNGGPGLREDYGPHYYAAFALDPDGNNVELVCRS